MKSAGIYRIVVRRDYAPDVYYFGQAVDLSERWKQHLRALRAGRHDNVRLQRSFAKYGETALSFETLLICEPIKQTLTLYEQAILDFYVASCGRNVLNVMRECVNSHLGVKRRPESIARLTAAITGKKRTPEQNAANAARRKGSIMPPETRAKLSASHKARPRHPNSMAALEGARTNPKQVEGLRLALAGRPKIHSTETKNKIAVALTGRKQSADLIERRIRKLRGRKQTAEEIAKRVASRLANAKAKSERHV